MTKSQIWVASFLGLFLILFAIGRITKKDEGPKKGPMGMMGGNSQQEMSSQELTAEQLIDRIGCNSCHGRDLQGTPSAPSLVGVGKNWTRDNLINYLRNPLSYMDSDRFKAYKEQYPNKIMPAFNNIDVKELGKIADYLLTLK